MHLKSDSFDGDSRVDEARDKRDQGLMLPRHPVGSVLIQPEFSAWVESVGKPERIGDPLGAEAPEDTGGLTCAHTGQWLVHYIPARDLARKVVHRGCDVVLDDSLQRDGISDALHPSHRIGVLCPNKGVSPDGHVVIIGEAHDLVGAGEIPSAFARLGGIPLECVLGCY